MRTPLLMAASLSLLLAGASAQEPPAKPQKPQPTTWFTDHQDWTGGWQAKSFPTYCPHREKCSGGPGASDQDTPATTALVLAMLTNLGYSGRGGHFSDNMKRGVMYLFNRLHDDGRIGPDSEDGRHLYNQALCIFALTEAMGPGGAPGEAIQKAINYLCKHQREDGAWPYGPDPKQGDAALTVWALIGLKSAALGGFKVPEGAAEKAFTWLESVRGEDGMIGWRSKGDGGERPAGCRWVGSQRALRAGVASTRLLYKKGLQDPSTVATAQWLLTQLPEAEKPDAVYGYFGTLVMYQMGGDYWQKWKPAFDTAVMKEIRRGEPRCRPGTWDPAKDAYGAEGGAIYTSTINMIASTIARRFPTTPKGK